MGCIPMLYVIIVLLSIRQEVLYLNMKDGVALSIQLVRVHEEELWDVSQCSYRLEIMKHHEKQ